MNNSSRSSSTTDERRDLVPKTAEAGWYAQFAGLTDEDTAWASNFVASLPQGSSPLEVENLYNQQQTLERKQDAFYKDFVDANAELRGLLEMARIEDEEIRTQLDKGVKTLRDMVEQQYSQLRNDHLSLRLDTFARINDMFLCTQRQLVEMRLEDRNKVAATARQEAEETANRAQEILKNRFEEVVDERKLMETRLQEVQEKAQESIRSLTVINHRLQSEVNARSDALENEMRAQEEVRALNSQIDMLQQKLNEKVVQISGINSEMEKFGLDKNTIVNAMEAYVKRGEAEKEAEKEAELQKDIEKELRVQLKTMTFERDCLSTALHMSADDIVQLVQAILWDMEQEERALKRMMTEEDGWIDMKVVPQDELTTQMPSPRHLQDNTNTEASDTNALEISGTRMLSQHVYTNLNAEKEVEKLKEQLRQADEAREVVETKVAAYEKSQRESDFQMRFGEMETEPAGKTSTIHDAHEPLLRPISQTSSFFSPSSRASIVGPIGVSLLDELGSEAFGSRPQSLYSDLAQHMSNPVTLIQGEPASESAAPACAMTEHRDPPAELAKVRAILEEQLQEQGELDMQTDKLRVTKPDLTILTGKFAEMQMKSEQSNEDELARLSRELEAKKVEAANAKAQTESVLAALTEMKKRVCHSSEEEGTGSLDELQDPRLCRGSRWAELVEQEIGVLPMVQDSEESKEGSEQNQWKPQAALIDRHDDEEEEVDEDATIPPQQENHIQGAPPQDGSLALHENNPPPQQPCLCLDCAAEGSRCVRCSRQVIAAERARVARVSVDNVLARIDPHCPSTVFHHIVSAWLRLLAFLFLQPFPLLCVGFFRTRQFVGNYIPCIRPGINVQVPLLLWSLGWVDTLLVSTTLVAFIIITLPLLTSNAAYRERQIWLAANDFTRMYLLDVQTYSPNWTVLLGVDPRLLFQFSSL